MDEKFYHLKFVLVSKSCEALLSMSGQRSPIDYPFQAIKFRHKSDSPFSYLVFDCSTQNYTFIIGNSLKIKLWEQEKINSSIFHVPDRKFHVHSHRKITDVRDCLGWTFKVEMLPILPITS